MSDINQMKSKQSRLIPLTDWPKHHTWPPLGGLRHLVFHAESNGFNHVIRRIGRRVLLMKALSSNGLNLKIKETIRLGGD